MTQVRRRLAALLDHQRPDVVLCHSPWGLTVFAPVARARGIPVVLWVHAAFTGRHWLDRVARLRARPGLAPGTRAATRARAPRALPGRASVPLP